MPVSRVLQQPSVAPARYECGVGVQATAQCCEFFDASSVVAADLDELAAIHADHLVIFNQPREQDLRGILATMAAYQKSDAFGVRWGHGSASGDRDLARAWEQNFKRVRHQSLCAGAVASAFMRRQFGVHHPRSCTYSNMSSRPKRCASQRPTRMPRMMATANATSHTGLSFMTILLASAVLGCCGSERSGRVCRRVGLVSAGRQPARPGHGYSGGKVPLSGEPRA
jgi:hypothetical protein